MSEQATAPSARPAAFRHGPRPAASIARLVGNTPLVRLRNVGRELPGVRLWAKLEFFNPGGSVKDRPALQMLRDAEERGELTRDRVVIDSTSGNTGVAYAWICAALGYKCALVMPSNVTEARKRIARAFGAELIYSDPMEGSDGAIRKVREIVAKSPDRWYYPDQYSNPSNPRAHELGTAAELWEQLEGELAAFVAGLGTSGTMVGTTRGLKAKDPEIRCVAVEPAEPMHGLEGLKHMATSIVPAIYEPKLLDGVLPVATDAGWDMAERLAREEGLIVGHSSGAAMVGALAVAKELAAAGKGGNVVTLFPDRADRYFEPRRWERKTAW